MRRSKSPWALLGQMTLFSLLFLALWSNPKNGAWFLWAFSYGGVAWWTSTRGQRDFGLQWPALWSAWCLASGIRMLPRVEESPWEPDAWFMPHAYALCISGVWLALQVLQRYCKPINDFIFDC